MLKASQKSTNTTNNKESNGKVLENGVKDTNGLAEKRPAESIINGSIEHIAKKKRILEKIHFEDLEDNNIVDDTQELKLSKVNIPPFHLGVFSFHTLLRCD